MAALPAARGPSGAAVRPEDGGAVLPATPVPARACRASTTPACMPARLGSSQPVQSSMDDPAGPAAGPSSSSPTAGVAETHEDGGPRTSMPAAAVHQCPGTAPAGHLLPTALSTLFECSPAELPAQLSTTGVALLRHTARFATADVEALAAAVATPVQTPATQATDAAASRICAAIRDLEGYLDAAAVGFVQAWVDARRGAQLWLLELQRGLDGLQVVASPLHAAKAAHRALTDQEWRGQQPLQRPLQRQPGTVVVGSGGGPVELQVFDEDAEAWDGGFVAIAALQQPGTSVVVVPHSHAGVQAMAAAAAEDRAEVARTLPTYRPVRVTLQPGELLLLSSGTAHALGAGQAVPHLCWHVHDDRDSGQRKAHLVRDMHPSTAFASKFGPCTAQ